MNEIEIIKLQVKITVTALQTKIARYYDALHELKRLSLLLMAETTATSKDIDDWFRSKGFAICENGFWQSMTDLNNHRQGKLSQHAISFSCHPDLRLDPIARLRMYVHRHVGRFLSDIRSRLPGSAWIYYQDASNIALQYPYIDQSTAISPDFDWSTYHTWTSVSPPNNPERKIQWTAPSIDYAGEGLILSVSIPLYLQDDFMGLWSIDLPMETLYQDCIEEIHIPEQQNFIADRDGKLIIHPIIKTKIDTHKGSIYRETVESIDSAFSAIDLSELTDIESGHTEMHFKDNRKFIVLYKAVPKINWIFFSLFPEDRMLEVVNNKIKSALEKVRGGEYSYSTANKPEFSDSNNFINSINEMARALEVQHHQIISSQKRMAQIEKMGAIGTLAGGIAHDFNNILSLILGYSELSLNDVTPDSMLKENLQEIYDAGIRAKELVRQILTFARQAEEESQPIHIATEAKEVLRLLRSSIPSSVKIHSRVESQSYIMGDPVNVHQIFMNLCTNASFAMKEGGLLTITVDDVTITEPRIINNTKVPTGTYIQLIVSDTGTGIPQEIIESIFEPYFTTKPVGEGTGMGLAMVHGIVKKYHGIIIVESELNKGTKFTIFFPTIVAQHESLVFQGETLPTGSETILFVDDEPSIAEMGKKSLSRYGYRVITQTSSIDALLLFKNESNRFNLVITDMTMPNMTGERLSIELLKIKPDIPIILCTGYSEKLSSEDALKIGVKAFLYKPIVLPDLIKVVRQVLDDTP